MSIKQKFHCVTRRQEFSLFELTISPNKFCQVGTAHVCSITYARTCTHISQYGWTALHLAAANGHEDVVELLLEAKANPELITVGQ